MEILVYNVGPFLGGAPYFVILRLTGQDTGDVLSFDMYGTVQQNHTSEAITIQRLEGLDMMGKRIGLHQLPERAMEVVLPAIRDLAEVHRPKFLTVTGREEQDKELEAAE